MASCSGIGVKEITSTRVLLKGIITGLDSSKNYCLHHFWGGWENVPKTNGQTYTYITGRTSVDLGSSGCYVPKNMTVEGQQFEVRLHEIDRTCENRIGSACSKILWYEVTEQRHVHFYVRDENGNPVNNTRIEIAGEAKYTGSDGKTYFILDTGSTYYARAYAPTEYTCDECYESFYHDSDTVINFYMSKKVVNCTLDFYVCDKQAYPIGGATCAAGGKIATTNTSGMCSLTLECGKTYTATCNAPSGYTCDCAGCDCIEGPFTLTGYKSSTFVVDKIAHVIEYCQQDFKVLDQNGDPVEYVIVGCEDRTDHTNFDVLGHAGTGTQRDGTVATLKTIKGRAYNFYISQYPAGYDFDIDGDSIFMDVSACTREVVFRIKNLAVVPDPCSVNVCVQDQDSNNISGVAIYIKDVGTVSTKDSIAMFGCTGDIGLICGRSVTVTATVPTGYDGVKTTETFTSLGSKNVILTIKEQTNGTECVGKTEANCVADPDCYWWDSDNACHDTPEPTTYPTLTITSDMDALSGLDAYVDGTRRGVTPITISFTESDIGGVVNVAGVFAGIMGTRDEEVTLKAGSNEVGIELLMDNKEILVGGTVAGILAISYAA